MASSNTPMVIRPYWNGGTWVFDDPQTGLVREPFVSGIPAMIDVLVRDIPDARSGFRLTFSAEPFPGFQKKVLLVRPESGGNWYRMEDPSAEGWLCPALYHYFQKAPPQLFVRADPA